MFNKVSNQTTNFFLKINESEDFLSPNYGTVKSLKEIKKYECGLVIALILNGVQVQKLMTFIHDCRSLSSTTKFVFLYDSRIFMPRFVYIWKKFVNVVFVKYFEVRNIFQRQINLKFEIHTVRYPDLLNEDFETREIKHWNHLYLENKTEVFNEKTSDLKGIELNIVAFKHIPMVEIDMEQNNTFKGVEIEIIESLAKSLNFTYKMYQTEDAFTEKLGQQLSNGSYSGLIGEMVNMRANLAVGDLHFLPYYLEFMDLSIPHFVECLTFLTPESTKDNSWATLILPFSADLWAGVFLSFIGGCILFYLLSCYRNSLFKTPPVKVFNTRTRKTTFRIQKDFFQDFTNCIFLTYSMLLQVSLPRLSLNWPVRIFTGWYWIYCILLVVAYRSSFTAILANPSPRIVIDTLEELTQTSITSGASNEQNKKFFSSSLDEEAQKIGAKMEIVNDVNSVIERVSAGQLAYYDNEYILRYLRASQKSGNQVLHIMKTCVVNMPISIGIEKNSPIKPNVDKYLRRLVEGGFISKWLKDSSEGLRSDEAQPQEALMNLRKFSSSFIALGIGYALALIAFIIEKLHFRFIVQRHPLYDNLNPRAYYQFIQNQKNCWSSNS